MILEQSLLSQIIFQSSHKILHNTISVILGVLVIAALAQVAIPLPWTPVPITGQTFGVSLIALLWGRKRGVVTVLTYLTLGAFGAPVFALGRYGLSWGPTAGYLVGMLIASYWMGYLADLGWTKTFLRTWLAAFLGSCIIFSCGVFVLSFFIPTKTLLIAGVLPFLPGDFIKTLISSSVAYQTHRSLENRI